MNLDAVRDALFSDADLRAADLLAAADAEGDEAEATARDRAEEMLEAARRDGDAEAHRVAALEEARARRAGRERVLAARRAAYRDLQEDCRRAAVGLRLHARYPELADGLARIARRQLGDGAAVQVDDDRGGLVATSRSRSVDYRLDAVAARCLAARAQEVEQLWR